MVVQLSTAVQACRLCSSVLILVFMTIIDFTKICYAHRECPLPVRKILSTFKAHGGMMNTRCPEEKWLEEYRTRMPARKSFVTLEIGCNKALDSMSMLRTFTKDPRYRKSVWMHATGLNDVKSCGVCGQCSVDPMIHSESAAISSYQHHCVEPLPTTFRALKKGHRALGLSASTFVLRNVAVTKSGTKPFVYFPKDSRPGKESIGLREMRTTGLVPVPAISVDKYVANFAVEKVDILLIDTEGNDANVLYGASRTLRAHKPFYVIFEYHKVLPWRLMKLKSLIDYMDDMKYECYWAHNKGMLFQITHCWHPHYDTHTWSNIACYHRSDKLMADIMRRISRESCVYRLSEREKGNATHFLTWTRPAKWIV